MYTSLNQFYGKSTNISLPNNQATLSGFNSPVGNSNTPAASIFPTAPKAAAGSDWYAEAMQRRANNQKKPSVVNVFDSNLRLIGRNTLDANGKIVEKAYISDGKFTGIDKFDSNGKVKEKDLFDADGNMTEADKFDSNGNKVEIDAFCNNGKVFQKSYLSNGKVTSIDKLNSAGIITEKDIFNANGVMTEADKYDLNGKVAEKDYFDLNGKMKEVNKFDSNNKLTERNVFDVNTGKLASKVVYDAATGKMKELNQRDANGNMNKLVYDIATGRMIEAGQFKEDGTAIYHKNYTYNDNADGSYTQIGTDHNIGNIVETAKFDSNKRLTEANTFTNSGKLASKVVYDAATGKMKELNQTDVNGNMDKYTYDIATGRIIEAGQFKGDGSAIYHRKYSYTNNANGTMATSTATDYKTGKVVETAKYDLNGNLTQIDAPNPDTSKLIYTVLFANGKRTEYIAYNADGGKTRFIYNDNGDGYKQVISYDATGKIV